MKSIYDLLNDIPDESNSYENPILSRSERTKMKRRFHRDVELTAAKRPTIRWAATAACLVCLVSFSQTAFAKTAINGILQTINLGHNIVVQEDPNAKPQKPEWYDKNGKLISSIPEGKPVNIYDKNGKLIGTVGHSASGSDSAENGCIVQNDIAKAVVQLSFHPLLPSSLPDGYAFDHANLYPNDDGTVNGDYIDLYYRKDGKQIFVQERLITPETTTTTGGQDVKTLEIHGQKAALIDGDTLEWEENGVEIYIASQKNLSEQELLSFAKSFGQSE